MSSVSSSKNQCAKLHFSPKVLSQGAGREELTDESVLTMYEWTYARLLVSSLVGSYANSIQEGLGAVCRSVRPRMSPSPLSSRSRL